MADLKMPNLNKNSEKYFFKKKLTLRRKSKRKLLNESILMILLSALIIFLNYLVPEKTLIFSSFYSNLNKSFSVSLELLSHLYEICLVLFIVISLILALFLFIGALTRTLKIIRIKTKKYPLSK